MLLRPHFASKLIVHAECGHGEVGLHTTLYAFPEHAGGHEVGFKTHPKGLGQAAWA